MTPIDHRSRGPVAALAAALLLPVLILIVLILIVLTLMGCSSQPDDGAAPPSADPPRTDSPQPGADASAGQDQRFPDVLDAELTAAPDGTFSLAVTISSPYDSAQRYADGWRVLTDEDEELGSHTLLHDHADEQPFTRTQTGLEVPAGIEQVVVEGRDSQNGYGGTAVTTPVP